MSALLKSLMSLLMSSTFSVLKHRLLLLFETFPFKLSFFSLFLSQVSYHHCIPNVLPAYSFSLTFSLHGYFSNKFIAHLDLDFSEKPQVCPILSQRVPRGSEFSCPQLIILTYTLTQPVLNSFHSLFHVLLPQSVFPKIKLMRWF